jgi:hypothetical protein
VSFLLAANVSLSSKPSLVLKGEMSNNFQKISFNCKTALQKQELFPL